MINVTIDMFYISHMDFTIEEIRMKKMNEGDLGLISEQGAIQSKPVCFNIHIGDCICVIRTYMYL